MNSRIQKPSRRPGSQGFTLVELLITAAILLILTTLTVAVYSTTASADRIRTSARQVQSAFGGARDRAIKAYKVNPLARRGIRLLVDATDPTTVTSMVYVGSDSSWSDGQVLIGRQDVDGNGKADNATVRTIRGWPRVLADGSVATTGWYNLYLQGLLVDGAKIRIPAGGGTLYTVSTYRLALNAGGPGPEILELTADYRVTPTTAYDAITPYGKGVDTKFGTNGALADDDQDGTPDNTQEAGAPNSDDITDINAFGSGAVTDYELELRPAVLPGQEPLRLSSGISIDLYNSRLPGNWYQQRSLVKGAGLPGIDLGWDAGSGSYYYNGWGVWAVEGTDPNNGANDLYRQYSPRMDIMFAPTGTVTGPLTTLGMLHLRLAEVEDIAEARDPANPQAAPMLYSTLFTQTGYLATFPVNLTDVYTNGTNPLVGPADNLADDPLYFARTGGTAGR